LAFSVPAGVKTPPTLRNILKELASDVGVERSTTDLTDWAQQGVLLLNTALTVRQHTPRSYLDLGIWDPVVKALVAAVARSETPTAFILWGKDAEEFEPLIAGTQHLIHKSAHPSPLAAYRGFWGSKPFTKVNAWLTAQGREPVVWA
jgi:uracil-DNA glycosylase